MLTFIFAVFFGL